MADALLMLLDSVYAYLEDNGFRSASSRKRVRIARRLCKVYGADGVVVLRRIREAYAVKEERGLQPLIGQRNTVMKTVHG